MPFLESAASYCFSLSRNSCICEGTSEFRHVRRGYLDDLARQAVEDCETHARDQFQTSSSANTFAPIIRKTMKPVMYALRCTNKAHSRTHDPTATNLIAEQADLVEQFLAGVVRALLVQVVDRSKRVQEQQAGHEISRSALLSSNRSHSEMAKVILMTSTKFLFCSAARKMRTHQPLQITTQSERSQVCNAARSSPHSIGWQGQAQH